MVDGLIAFVSSFVLAIAVLPGFFFGIGATSIVVPWLYFFLILVGHTSINFVTIEIVPRAKLQPLLSFIIMWGPSYARYAFNNLSLPAKNAICLVPSLAYSLSADVFVAFYQGRDLFADPDKYGLRLNHFYATVNPSEVTSDDAFTTNQR